MPVAEHAAPCAGHTVRETSHIPLSIWRGGEDLGSVPARVFELWYCIRHSDKNSNPVTLNIMLCMCMSSSKLPACVRNGTPIPLALEINTKSNTKAKKRIACLKAKWSLGLQLAHLPVIEELIRIASCHLKSIPPPSFELRASCLT